MSHEGYSCQFVHGDLKNGMCGAYSTLFVEWEDESFHLKTYYSYYCCETHFHEDIKTWNFETDNLGQYKIKYLN